MSASELLDILKCDVQGLRSADDDISRLLVEEGEALPHDIVTTGRNAKHSLFMTCEWRDDEYEVAVPLFVEDADVLKDWRIGFVLPALAAPATSMIFALGRSQHENDFNERSSARQQP